MSLLFIYLFIHSFIHSFIHLFIYTKTSLLRPIQLKALKLKTNEATAGTKWKLTTRGCKRHSEELSHSWNCKVGPVFASVFLSEDWPSTSVRQLPADGSPSESRSRQERRRGSKWNHCDCDVKPPGWPACRQSNCNSTHW